MTAFDDMDINVILSNDQPRNVVWQVPDPSDFERVLQPLADHAIRSGRSVIRIRFVEDDNSGSSRQPLYASEVRTVSVSLAHRFETFTVAVHDAILSAGTHNLFIFDSLSRLQTAWATDLMMGNFFRVIAPVILKQDSTAFFPLIRGMHANRTIDIIRDNTEIFLNLYSDFRSIYLRPEKVDQLSDGAVFQPHVYVPGERAFKPIMDGVLLSHFHQALNQGSSLGRQQNMDSWDRFFENTQRAYENGEEIQADCDRMCQIMMSRDEHMRRMIRSNFFPEDYFFVKEHMIGTGLIGGKACGMLTARKIIENHRPDIYEKLEPHDSFFIGSDVYYSYIVENDFWDLRVRQRTPEGYFSLADSFADRLRKGVFSEELEEQFRHLLDYYGQSPVIVRSSSILEDGFGNAFAGKYESVFCANTGSPESRLTEFENAIRTVYASTMSRSALDYRKRRGLENRDEQMALLVQRVSGSHYGHYFMPCAAGVGYSYSTYRFLKDLDPQAGMLRLVMGLGTSAVDRTEGSYPRLVSLDKPEATPYATSFEHRRYSQQNIEVIDKNTRQLTRIRLKDILPELPYYLKNLLVEHDFNAERAFRERGQRQEVTFISCKGLVKNESLMRTMQDMMAAIRDEYQYPVDIEFTMNLSEDGEYIINLLQCRPLQAFHDTGKAAIPEKLPEDQVWIDCHGTTMGNSEVLPLDRILYVDPMAYYHLPYAEKPAIARMIGAVNWYYRGRNKAMLLMVPGRVGTSSPELGVPTTFADISEFNVVFEIAESKIGYNPELSYGSHIFQDLVENEILYVAVFEDEHTRCFHPDRLPSDQNLLTEIPGIGEDARRYADVLRLIDVSGKCTLYHDMLNERLVSLLHETNLEV